MAFLRPINDVDPRLTPHNRSAISYLLQKESDIELSEVFTEGQKKHETDDEAFRFVVMIMKLSGCENPLVNMVVESSQAETSLKKADKFDLLNQCLTNDGNPDETSDETETLISEFKMRAIVISLDSLLCERKHDQIFVNYICSKLRVDPKKFKTNFALYKHLEDTEEIEPGRLEFIRGALNADKRLQKELSHFVQLLEKLKPKMKLQAELFASHQREMYSHSVSSEETDPPPDYTSTDKLCVTGATSTSSVSCETSSTRLRTTSDGSASFHHRPPRLSNAQRQSTFPPMNESPTLPPPTQAQANFTEPNNPGRTTTELSNAANSISGGIDN